MVEMGVGDEYMAYGMLFLKVQRRAYGACIDKQDAVDEEDVGLNPLASVPEHRNSQFSCTPLGYLWRW